MLIQTIKIQNFRGIEGYKEFSFEGKPFVLLAAPNGLGKTTIIDAIEWCLTGNISRLKNAFDTRSTNDDERKKNVDGILKNKKAPEEAEISVVLNIVDKDKTYEIKRVQKKDELNAKISKVWVDDSQNQAIELLPQIADHNFYNFHFCDVQKSIQIQNRKRKDLPDLFSEFITDYTRENIVADNLDLFVEDVSRYKQDMDGKKIPLEAISEMQKALEQYGDAPTLQNYPESQMYTGENVLISELDENMLKNQLKMLYKCGYKQADMLLDEILRDDNLRDIGKDLTELADILKVKKEKIDQTIAKGLHIGRQNIVNLEIRIKQYKEINITKDNIWSNLDFLLAINSSTFTREEYNESKLEIQQLENSLNNIKGEIETLSKGNDILDALSSLVSKEQGLKKYREEKLQKNENVNCPICGSERFGQIEQSQILRDAKEYINDHGLLLTQKMKNKDQLENQIVLKNETLIEICNQILADEVQKAEDEKANLINLQEETADFFNLGKRLGQMDTQKYALEQLVLPEYIDSVRNEIEKKFLSPDEISQKRELLKKLLELLEYKTVEIEDEKVTAQKIHELSKDAPNMIMFTHELLVQKISSVNSILRNCKKITCTFYCGDTLGDMV